MASKRLKIENLDNLQELNAEEVFSIQGGLSEEDSELKASELSVESKRLIYRDFPYPLPDKPDFPYPLPDRPTKPYWSLPHIPCSLRPDGKLPWCAVIL